MLLGIAGDGSGQVELGMTNTTMNKGKGQQSRRDRAYSVSDSSYVFPLPTTMFTSAIFKALALPQRHVYLRDELIDTVLRKQSWAVNIMSAMKQSIPANPATSTRFGWLKLYAHNEGLPLERFASSRSLDSVGKSKSHLFVEL